MAVINPPERKLAKRISVHWFGVPNHEPMVQWFMTKPMNETHANISISVQYGNTGSGVFKWGYKIRKIFA